MKERKKEDGLIAQEDTDSANSKKRRRILDDTGLREASRSKKSKKPTKQHEICTEKSAKDQNIKTESTFTWIEGQISGADSIEHSEHKNKMGKKRMSGLVDVTEFPAGATSEILDNESSRGERKGLQVERKHSEATDPEEDPTSRKEKKRLRRERRHREAADLENDQASRKEKKRLRRERKHSEAADLENDQASRKEKKRLRRERRQIIASVDAEDEKTVQKETGRLGKEPKKNILLDKTSPSTCIEQKSKNTKTPKLTNNTKDSKQNTTDILQTGNNKPTKILESRKLESGAEQWNPDALSGDAARKNKFLRLLGAGKSNNLDHSARISGPSKKLQDLLQIETELAKQFDAGTRMKHDGQGKRRGLGA